MDHERERAIRQLAAYLRRKGSPRIFVAAILLGTGSVGFFCSLVLLNVGLDSMWLRYPISATVAYSAFLGGIRTWRESLLNRPELAADLEAVQDESPLPRPRKERELWDLGLDVFPFDDGPWPLVLTVVVILAVVAALGYVIALAPVLLAEILLDGLLVAGLWRRYRRTVAAGRVDTTLRLTWVPALLVIVGLGLVGAVFEWLAPGASSIGDVFG